MSILFESETKPVLLYTSPTIYIKNKNVRKNLVASQKLLKNLSLRNHHNTMWLMIFIYDLETQQYHPTNSNGRPDPDITWDFFYSPLLGFYYFHMLRHTFLRVIRYVCLQVADLYKYSYCCKYNSLQSRALPL